MSETLIITPAVSVIIPVYNVEPYLRQCLDSVVSQTLRNIEIICINDGSPDNSLEILREYEANDSRIIVISRENKGVGYSRNEGIGRATGEFVIFMDSDDWYPSDDNLEELYTKSKENNALICGGSLSAINNNKGAFFSEYPNVFKAEGFVDYKAYQYPYFYQRFLFDRKMLIENDIYFPNYKRFQDPPFFVRAMIQAERFYAIEPATYGYRVSHKEVKYTDETVIDILKGMNDCLKLSNQYNLLNLQSIIASMLPRKGYNSLPINKNLHSNNVDVHLAFLELLNTVNSGHLGTIFVMQCLSIFSSYVYKSISLSNNITPREHVVNLIKLRKHSFGAYKDFLMQNKIYDEVHTSFEVLKSKSSKHLISKNSITE